MATRPTVEPFPSYRSEVEEIPEVRPQTQDGQSKDTSRRPSVTSRLSKAASTRTRARTSSLIQSFIESNPPLGMWQATGEVGSKIPTLPEIRNGAFADEGWTHEGQMEHRGTNPHEIHRRRIARTSSASTRTRKSSVSANAPPVITEERHEFFPRRGSVSIVQEPLFEEPSTVRSAREVEEIQPTQK